MAQQLVVDRDESIARGRTVFVPFALPGTGVARLVRITRAAYDALPTPRPVDTLYLITA